MSFSGKSADVLAGQDSSPPELPGATATSMRDVMAQFATGVVLLSVGGEHVHGMTANAFTSVSLRPPQVLCCVSHTAVMHAAITAAGLFGVSVMGADQADLARYFADKSRPLGAAQFEGVSWRAGEHSGAPLLAGALAWLECEIVQSYDGGDHSIIVGSVLAAGRGPDHPGLLFFDGGFQPAPRRAG
ncbi:flavin reductase family protein [Micromonospora sp. WMMC250]|nr:flavin reductase family protein [Micromonospora sp. WMMC250]MCZ7373497.1 flavin reductase family protein [Micromonospora sp. WMMC250]